MQKFLKLFLFIFVLNISGNTYYETYYGKRLYELEEQNTQLHKVLEQSRSDISFYRWFSYFTSPSKKYRIRIQRNVAYLKSIVIILNNVTREAEEKLSRMKAEHQDDRNRLTGNLASMALLPMTLLFLGADAVQQAKAKRNIEIMVNCKQELQQTIDALQSLLNK